MAAPPGYLHGHHTSVLRSHSWRTAANSAAYLLPHLGPGRDLLDVGCGPGTITADLALACSPGRVVGLDAATEVLELARATAAERGVQNLTFESGDAYNLAHADASFDVVHAHQVLQHLSRPVAALSEWLRVCRPGGVVAVREADFAAMAWYPADPRLDRWLELYDRVARSTGGEPNAGRHLKAWAQAAGAGEPSCSASAWCYSTPAERSWWAGIWAERTTQSRFREHALASGISSPDELAGLAQAWREWSAHTDGWFSVLHGELLIRAG